MAGNTITVIARKWFDKINGNTYHSCEVYVNGKLIERDPKSYGYGTQYEETALAILYKHGIYPRPDNGIWESLYSLIKRNGDNHVISCTTVLRKKDL